MRYLIVLIIIILPMMLYAEEKEKAYMGVYHEAVSELPSVDGAPEATGGVLIQDTREDTPAYRGGLRCGDIIIAFDDYVFDCTEEEIDGKFKDILAEYSPGDRMPITILRMVVTKKLIANGEEYDSKEYLKSRVLQLIQGHIVR